MLPKKDTASFKIMECLFRYGDMSLDQIIKKIGFVTSQPKRSVMATLIRHMVNRNYLIEYNENYALSSEMKAYVEDVYEISGMIKKENVVSSPYINIFTPEMKNYNLFANKRGY